MADKAISDVLGEDVLAIYTFAVVDQALRAWVKAHVVARRNARSGRSAAEHLVAALLRLHTEKPAAGEGRWPCVRLIWIRSSARHCHRLKVNPAGTLSRATKIKG